ncbi:MAG: hypothetical protein IAF94_26785, partial [Pirellulaceae bacterium]|nr:hypothetical protein [Pirellulaceae bacterium]
MKLRHWIVSLAAVAFLGFPLAASAQLEEVEDIIEEVKRVIRPARAVPPPMVEGAAEEPVPDDP